MKDSPTFHKLHCSKFNLENNQLWWRNKYYYSFFLKKSYVQRLIFPIFSWELWELKYTLLATYLLLRHCENKNSNPFLLSTYCVPGNGLSGWGRGYNSVEIIFNFLNYAVRRVEGPGDATSSSLVHSPAPLGVLVSAASTTMQPVSVANLGILLDSALTSQPINLPTSLIAGISECIDFYSHCRCFL